MADVKITALTVLTAADPINDAIPIVDVSDNSMAASGTTKRISVNNILGASGTATLASATITGDLTVDTSTLKVDSANNRVGIVQATPLYPLHLVGEFGLQEETPAGSGTKLRFIGDATKYNFRLGKQLTATNAFEITPSTAAGGTTFSNPVYTVTYDGIHAFLDGAGGTRMTLNSTGLGVAVSPTEKLTVNNTLGAVTGGIRVYANDQSIARIAVQNTNGQAWHLVAGNPGANNQGFAIYDYTNSATRLYIDTSGNVGVGVTPSAWGGAFKALQISRAGLRGSTATSGLSFNAYFDGTDFRYIAASTKACDYFQNSGNHVWQIADVGAAGGVIPFTQAMTLDTSGNLLVGTTSAVASGSTFQNLGAARQVLTLKGNDATSYTLGLWSATTTGDNFFAYFGTEASTTVRGSVTYNRAGGLVAYNTTSDYRAKDIIGSVSNSGSLIDSLKVYVGKMKGATIERPMLIAHEAQEVAPYAVTGTKDEVDAEGNAKYQQMDVSSFVPLLIAEIQSLRTRVQTLEAK